MLCTFSHFQLFNLLLWLSSEHSSIYPDHSLAVELKHSEDKNMITSEYVWMIIISVLTAILLLMHPKTVLVLFTASYYYLLAMCVVEQMLESFRPGRESLLDVLQPVDLESVY